MKHLSDLTRLEALLFAWICSQPGGALAMNEEPRCAGSWAETHHVHGIKQMLGASAPVGVWFFTRTRSSTIISSIF